MRYIKTLISAACLVVLPAGLVAQDMGGPPQPPAQQQVADVSEKDLNRAAEAYVEVIQAQQQHQTKLQGITDPQEVQAAQQSANQEIEKLISDAGLTIDKYNETMQAVQVDNELQQQFLAMVSKHQQK